MSTSTIKAPELIYGVISGTTIGDLEAGVQKEILVPCSMYAGAFQYYGSSHSVDWIIRSKSGSGTVIRATAVGTLLAKDWCFWYVGTR